MHCPKCGQQQISDAIRYCSRCGFLLTGVAAVVENDGHIPGEALDAAGAQSPRRRGIKQGVFLFLLSFLVVPLLGLVSLAANSEPVLAGIGFFLCVIGGLLRIVYAFMFESNNPGGATLEENVLASSRKYLKKRKAEQQLPAGDPTPASVYTSPDPGTWRETNELAIPPSVTDSTTKLLSREEDTN